MARTFKPGRRPLSARPADPRKHSREQERQAARLDIGEGLAALDASLDAPAREWRPLPHIVSVRATPEGVTAVTRAGEVLPAWDYV